MRPYDVVPRARAEQDINDALEFYFAQAGETVALGFIDAVERAYRLIGEQPNAGSSRYAHELDLRGLRSWPLRDYPYVVFYVPRDEHIDVWRVLHTARDLPAWMTKVD